MNSHFLRLALVLGLLSAIGPFAIDMYLPALPTIGSNLGADIGAVQMSLVVFFVAIGVGQLFYGPLSDMVGRKPPLYFGIGLFALASVGCALATDIQMLIGLRFLQGLGAAASMVIPRAVVRDLHTGHEAARLMSLLMLVFSVSPILAPLLGSAIISLSDWRGVFWAVTLAALMGLVLTATVLQETRPAAQRVQSNLGNLGNLGGALQAYARLLRDRHYLGLVMIGGTAMGGFFTYLANSSFVFIEHYGLTPLQYSLAFSLNAVAFIGAAQCNGALGARFGLVPVVQKAVSACAVVMLVLVAYYLLGGDQLAVLVSLYFIASALMGLVIPTTSVLALEQHGAIAGTASALLGTLQMLTGAVMMGSVGLFASATPLPMVIGMGVGVWMAWLLSRKTLGRPSRSAQLQGL